MQRQSYTVLYTIHWNLEEELSNTDTRKRRRHHTYFKVEAANYKEIKQKAEVDNAYESDSSENIDNYKENKQEAEANKEYEFNSSENTSGGMETKKRNRKQR